MDESISLFAVSAPGLEPVLSQELARLGIKASAEPGGVAWRGPATDIATANLELRTASRVLFRTAEFRARTFHELERRARRVDWDRFVASTDTVRLRTTCRKSALYHEGAVAQRILEAIEERTGCRGSTGSPDDEEGDTSPGQLFVVRFFRDLCTISADTSGDLLHRRGYREALAKAPLRETLAAAMLLASGWQPDAALLDPFCGSGTIAIEATLIVRDIAPGLASAERTPRPYRFLDWPAPPPNWDETVERARSRIRPRCIAPICASDRNAGAIRAATANAMRAGVGHDIRFDVEPFSAVQPPAANGWIVTNPPYGERIGSRSAAAQLVKDLERRIAADFPRWQTAALLPARLLSRSPAGRPGRPPTTSGATDHSHRIAFETRNGGIPVGLRVSTPPPQPETD